jgi:hypothetical protein
MYWNNNNFNLNTYKCNLHYYLIKYCLLVFCSSLLNREGGFTYAQRRGFIVVRIQMKM